MAHQQYLLLFAKARSLSIKRLHTLTDEQTFDLFRELRWASAQNRDKPQFLVCTPSRLEIIAQMKPEPTTFQH